MRFTNAFALAPALMLAAGLAAPAPAGEQEAIDGCIDEVRRITGGGGEVLSSEFSEAATLVRLRDANGTE